MDACQGNSLQGGVGPVLGVYVVTPDGSVLGEAGSGKQHVQLR